MICPRCGGLMLREPASVTCVLCGRFAVVLDATDADRGAQRDLDIALRPCSVECLSEFTAPRPLGWVAGRMRLPGERKA